ncbi:CipC1 protein [Athelia psychrophila]|uniref:CipC1 protein n=1 Tax=Athelia psychrophila TaxID=1759441 RepID=A0A166VSJ2_9AGAM|nr:CipC1 protein [Fibularhizoctonia sp. CBS 109695]
MGWFDGAKDQADQYNDTQDNLGQHQASKVHELIGGAAAYEAAKAYENRDGGSKAGSHAEAKEIMAGLAGAFIDREVETRGMDTFDKEKAKYEARKNAQNHINNYSEQDYNQ